MLGRKPILIINTTNILKLLLMHITKLCTSGEMVGPLLPYLLLPPSHSSPHPPPPHVKPLVMMIFVLQNGWSPLMTASEKGHLDVVTTLVEAGANVNHTNKVGICTLLLYTYTVLLFCLSSASLCTCSCHNDVIGTNNYLSLQCCCCHLQVTMYTYLYHLKHVELDFNHGCTVTNGYMQARSQEKSGRGGGGGGRSIDFPPPHPHPTSTYCHIQLLRLSTGDPALWHSGRPP